MGIITSCLIHFTTSTTFPGGFFGCTVGKTSCKSARSDTLLAFSERYSLTARTETDKLIRQLHRPSRGRHTGPGSDPGERERERDEVCDSFFTDGGGETLRKYLRISSWILNNMKLLQARLCKKKFFKKHLSHETKLQQRRFLYITRLAGVEDLLQLLKWVSGVVTQIFSISPSRESWTHPLVILQY